MNNMRCAIYARTATTDQSCEKQLQELRDYVAHQGWTVGGEYMDTGRSGTGPRPSLTRLMQHAREGGLDAVVVMRLDRWGRTFRAPHRIADMIKDCGCRHDFPMRRDPNPGCPVAHRTVMVAALVIDFCSAPHQREQLLLQLRAVVKFDFAGRQQRLE